MRIGSTSRQDGRNNREPDMIGLINIVFLMLIFFLVAGTLRPYADRGIELAKAGDAAVTARRAVVVIDAGGQMSYRGDAISEADLPDVARRHVTAARGDHMLVVADRRAPAQQVIATLQALQSAGVPTVSLLTERRRAN